MARTTLETGARSAVIVLLWRCRLSLAALLQSLRFAAGLLLLVVFLGERRVRLREVLLIDVLVALIGIVAAIRHLFTCRMGVLVVDCVARTSPQGAAAGHCIFTPSARA
jgi:hypothetical protein